MGRSMVRGVFLSGVALACRGIEIGLNATNVLDKKYLTSCYLTAYNGWCWYGNRRTVQGTIGFKW
jgi:iron complex outermembrane recepter protein